MRCAEVREILPSVVHDGGGTLSVRRHLASCSACREELGNYESLLVSLGDLRGHHSAVPAAVTDALLAIPQRRSLVTGARAHVSRNRRAYVSGAAVVVAGAGAALWRARARRVATA